MAWAHIGEAYDSFEEVADRWVYDQDYHYTNPWETRRTDCSGLVWWLIDSLDEACARAMTWQGSTNTTAFQQTCDFVGRDLGAIEPGDIILCNYGTTSSVMGGGHSGSHVAMYVGDGEVIDMFPGCDMRERSVWELVGEVGWWGIYRPPYTDTASADAPQGAGGTYRCTAEPHLNVRSAPTTDGYLVYDGDGNQVVYMPGETVVLDDWRTEADGYVWGRYTGGSGNLRYLAVGTADGSETYLELV